MLNATHGLGRKLAGLLLAGTATLGGLTIATPAAADEPKPQRKEIRTVIVEHDGKGPAGATWEGKDGEPMKLDCPGMLTEVEAAPSGTDEKKEKAKIVICSKGGSKAEAAQGLERALADVEKNEDMDAAMKADLKAKLAAKIAELRAGN